MNIERKDDGVQIEINGNPSVLVTIRQHPDYGFKGCVLTKNEADNTMEIVDFHGDGIDGVCVHGPAPFKEET